MRHRSQRWTAACSLTFLVAIRAPAHAAVDFENIRQVPVRDPFVVPSTAIATIAFNRMVSGISTVEEVIQSSYGPFCSDTRKLVWSQVSPVVSAKFQQVVARDLPTAGYHVPAKSEQVFDTAKAPRPDLYLGVRVREFRMSTCSGSSGVKGAVYLDTHWEVYGGKARKVIAAFDVQGGYASDSREKMELTDFIERGVAGVVHNLLADPQLAQAATDFKPVVAEATLPDAPLHFARVAPPDGGVTKNAVRLRAAVVTVEAGNESGSGFHVSKEGYLPTDGHVVADGTFVKIRTATGRELPGEVVASDATRDVALIKTKAPPFEPLAPSAATPTSAKRSTRSARRSATASPAASRRA